MNLTMTVKVDHYIYIYSLYYLKNMIIKTNKYKKVYVIDSEYFQIFRELFKKLWYATKKTFANFYK